MADQTAEQLQNMSLQDYDSSEFDPLSPQNCKAGNFPYTDTQGVDLLGDSGADLTGVTNGHGKNVLFDDESMGLPDPTYVGQSQPAKKELFQHHMSTGEILGYQNEYGESGITGQMEYGMDSDDEEECDNNLVNFGETQNQPPPNYPVEPVDQEYLLSTGQPLLDFSNDLQTVPPVNQQQDLLGEDNFDDYSSPVEYQNQDDMDDKEYFDSVDPYYAQGPIENDYPNDDIDPNNWQPEVDNERSRRSLSPERSMSPKRQDYSQLEGAEGVMSPQCDTESFDNLDSIDENSYSESHPAPVGSVQDQVIPNYEADSSDRSHVDYSETDSVTSDASGVQKFKSGVPRPRKIKKPKELPPWNDNVVIPKKPKPRPTFIGNKEYLPTASSSPDRPQTAPIHSVAKDASSDSGVEDDKTQTRMNSADSKKYGTDSKNDKYKPGGGQIQIFSKKVDTKHVSPRTDTKTPKSALTPRSPVKSPTPQRASTPNTRQVHSKIGSLNNVKHSPGGGNVAIVSNKPDFSTVKSKVGSKDKIDHKPKGGDKKIETKKLDWKVESKVGSLKNATHTAGGGNLKDGSLEVKGTMNTRENIGYIPGGGNVPEPWEEELDWEADAQVNSLDNLDYVPGGGKVRIESHRTSWSATSRIGSLENATHVAGGGKKKIESHRTSWSATSRVGSLENTTHVPGGGKVKILDQKVEIKAQSKIGSTANIKHKPGGGDKKIETVKLDFTDKAKSKVGSMDKVKHQPGGGDIKVFKESLQWNTHSRVESLANVKHVPRGGDVKILDEKIDFTDKAKSRVGSMDKVKHVPGGGDKKIETQKLSFKESAKPRTDTGGGSGQPRSHDSHSRSESVTSSQDGSIQE